MREGEWGSGGVVEWKRLGGEGWDIFLNLYSFEQPSERMWLLSFLCTATECIWRGFDFIAVCDLLNHFLRFIFV